MQMNLIRYEFTERSTLGKLSIDGVFFCYTLERVSDGKNIPNESSIPEGTYPVKERWSSHFGRNVLAVCNVTNRTDIEIHIANLPGQLLGCIAVGKTAANDHVGLSTVAFNDLMAKFRAPCTLTIESARRDVIPAPDTEAIA